MAAQKANNSSFARRKAFAIKHQEAEPLTRRDLQYDFLYHIFAAQERVFTDPTLSSKEGGGGGGGGSGGTGTGTGRVTFRDLYVHALMSSPRCSKALREKMQETPEFASDFAKMSLLANVGRVNTTMTFLPEMRTALRTYHPVPSLQKADANLQDAPRIKNILKACSLKDEAATNMPVTPAELRARAATGIVPSTSIVNLLFVLSNHFTTVAHDHFGCRDIDFLDLFLPIKISSPSRARAFLWLAFHYHEAPSLNPFEDQQARKHLGLIPELIPLSEEEFEKENVDPEDERNYATKMTKLRIDFLAKNAQGAENNNRKGTAKSKVRAPSPGKSIPAKRERSDPDSAAEDESDHLGPPSRRRRPKTLNPSRALSESSISRLSNRHSGGPHRSILQQAWHVVTTVDAFLDSDDEDIDESARHAYAMRLQVLADFHQSITADCPSQWQRASAT
jgi:Ino eighty subunit 1